MVFEKIREIIVDVMGNRLHIDADEIGENTEFIADLHADSMDLASIITEVEENFNIEIDDEQLEGIRTIGDVVERISELI
ncbi:MAG: acyl carrier protein [Clostridia bacterium]|nr:acyl carrier protein [Clostridia bacterium]